MKDYGQNHLIKIVKDFGQNIKAFLSKSKRMLVRTLRDLCLNKTLKNFGNNQNPKLFWSNSFGENVKGFL